ncbi:TPA: GNAT family N-acetyltransferase [Enterobacter asburiae]
MSFTLEPLTVKHLPFFYDIRFSVNENMLLPQHIQYLHRKQLVDDIEQGGGWIAVSDTKYIGAGFGVCIPEPLVGGLFVKPEYQRAGVGRAILTKIEEWAVLKNKRSLSLTTDAGSSAEFFYVRNGYSKTGLDEYGQAVYIKRFV